MNTDGYLQCRNTLISRESERVYNIFIENNYELLVFETPLSTRVICSGDFFQTNIWGKTSFNIWILKRGLNKCFVSTNTYIIDIGNNIYIVSKNTAPEQLSEELIRVLNHVKIMNNRGECVFLVEENTGINLFFENIVSGRETELLLKHLSALLKNRFSRKEDADTYYELVRKQLLIEYS